MLCGAPTPANSSQDNLVSIHLGVLDVVVAFVRPWHGRQLDLVWQSRKREESDDQSHSVVEEIPKDFGALLWLSTALFRHTNSRFISNPQAVNVLGFAGKLSVID